MTPDLPEPFQRFRPHPWHGLEVGPDPPHVVCAYIEITPFELTKYVLDKRSGFLRVDRPQRSSSQPPTLYGLIPRTYCGDRVRDLSPGSERGDGDPLDICVVSERPIDRAEVLVDARVIGGLEIIDGGEADDKIIAVLRNDDLWRSAREIEDLPELLVERLRHDFETYKLIPGEQARVGVDRVYGREHAPMVIAAACADYEDRFGS